MGRRGCCAGVRADVAARAPLCASDWSRAHPRRALAAGLFAFVSQAVPAAAFAELLHSRTHGETGVVEALLGEWLGLSSQAGVLSAYAV